MFFFYIHNKRNVVFDNDRKTPLRPQDLILSEITLSTLTKEMFFYKTFRVRKPGIFGRGKLTK